MNFKRKRCKRQVRCTMCTQNRWRGNSMKDANPKLLKVNAQAKLRGH